MSGLNSATLTPFGKSDKRANKSPGKTHRFGFTLSDPNEDSCSVFDYGSVVKLEERKLIKKRREERENKANGTFNPFNNDDENDDDVRRLARKFEEKYGEKKSRSKSYAELGAGYDETDPFIDNTEAQDEELEEDQETPCGGYYVNCGPLELKKVDVSDQSDVDDAGRRKHKRVLSAIEEDAVNEEVDEEEEVNGEEVDTEAKSEKEEIIPENKKEKNFDEKEEELEQKSPENTDILEDSVKKKRKRVLPEDIMNSAVIKPKKVKTVKALLEEKRVVHETQSADEPKRHLASSTSINEAIESVINAGHHDETSNTSNSSKSGSSASEDSQDTKPSSQNLPPPLPENLSADLMTLVENIRHTAAVTDNTRKTFCTDINSSLVKLEWKSRDLSTTNRNLLFAHLAFYLPCTKDTLMRRAKKLFIVKEESQLETVICKLKATIDAAMPSLEEKYEKERQRIIEEQGINASQSNGATPGGDNMQSPETAVGKLPKRKFPWSDEIRGYLKEIIRLKKRCYKVLKPRKNTIEEYITHFISSKVRVLWPSGWMKTSSLLRECSFYLGGKLRRSSSHSPNKSDSSRLNSSYQSQSANNSSVHVQSSADAPQQSTHSPPTLSHEADPLNLLAKITTSIPSHPKSPKTDKPESFSMDSLLKRTSEIKNCHEYNTTLSDLMKQDSVLMNGVSLPLNNVNNSQTDDSVKSETVLDLSSCNNSVSGPPSVIQSVSSNERTAMRASDSVSLNTITHPSSSHCKKESSSAEAKKVVKDLERRMSEETTTATDILSQIINESLMAPSPGIEEKKCETPVSKEQELLFDVMQDLRELNHMSSKQKKNSYSGVSWSQPSTKPADKKGESSTYHNEFLKHIYLGGKHNPSSPYLSPFKNAPYMNDSSNPAYNSNPHRSAQSSHAGSTSGKVPQLNQSCGMKPLPNTGISSGHPQRYPMEYASNDQHVLPPALPFAVHNWYPGSESQPHQ